MPWRGRRVVKPLDALQLLVADSIKADRALRTLGDIEVMEDARETEDLEGCVR